MKLAIREQKINIREIDCDISINNQLKIKHDRRQDIKSMNIEDSQNDKLADKNKSKNVDKYRDITSGFRKKILYGQKESMNTLAIKIPEKNSEANLNALKLPFSNPNEKASVVNTRDR